MINASSVKDIDLYKIAQYKGQLHTLDMYLDLKEFLSEKIEVK